MQSVVRCGGQADNALAVLGAAVSAEYAKLDATKQAELCQGINDAAGWDVQQWAFAESGMATQVASNEGMCGEVGTASQGTLTVGGTCHFAGEVNYFLWGYVNALCGNWLWTTKAGVSAWIRVKNQFNNGTDARYLNESGRTNWTEVGWKAAKGRNWSVPAGSAGFAYPPCNTSITGSLTWVLGIYDGAHTAIWGTLDPTSSPSAAPAAPATPAPSPTPAAAPSNQTDCATLKSVCSGSCMSAGCCKAKNAECYGSFFTCYPPTRCQ
ncbi:MAG: hypothetical protein IT371_27600 [Deltaproteobacteria bacterium]|nr:hypothetical protein [Deltaproteobacteria bacterium]